MTIHAPNEFLNPTRDTHAAELIRLRWVAILGQVLTVLVAHFLLATQLPLVAIMGVIGLEILVNIAAIWWSGRNQAPRPERLLTFMVVDLLVLTALLYLTGGPYNPFSLLYLVHIALSALILDMRGTWVLGTLSMACYGLLFLSHLPLPMPHGAEADMMHAPESSDGALNLHVQGMWVAFAVAAVTITYFVGRLTRALDEQRTQLNDARLKAYRTEKAAALATLATGAAHELATPLSTIAVVSKDLEEDARALQGETSAGTPSPPAGELIVDAQLIRSQVDRCRQILEQLAVDTGQTLGESDQSFALGDLLGEAIEPLDTDERLVKSIPAELVDAHFSGPRRTLAHAVRALVKNALQASSETESPSNTPASPVQINVEYHRNQLIFEVIDLGPGIPEDKLSRVTEPFFSTKAVGEGMGLGLFLTQSVADTLGGELHLKSLHPHGTRARLSLPLKKIIRPDIAPQPGKKPTPSSTTQPLKH